MFITITQVQIKWSSCVQSTHGTRYIQSSYNKCQWIS